MLLRGKSSARRWDNSIANINNPNFGDNINVNVNDVNNGLPLMIDIRSRRFGMVKTSKTYDNVNDKYVYNYSRAHINEYIATNASNSASVMNNTPGIYRIKSTQLINSNDKSIVINTYENRFYDNKLSLDNMPYELQLSGGLYQYPNGNYFSYIPHNNNFVDYNNLANNGNGINNIRAVTFLVNLNSLKLGSNFGIGDGIKSLTIELINDGGGVGIGDDNRIDTGLTSAIGDDPGICNNTDFGMYIMFASSGLNNTDNNHQAKVIRNGITYSQLNTVTPVYVDNVNIWLNANKAYTGGPLTEDSGVVDTSELSNTNSKKRLTFGTEVWYGDLIIRIELSKLSNVKFSGVSLSH
jgi:hypothetical protein